jgi:hypothetical protein
MDESSLYFDSDHNSTQTHIRLAQRKENSRPASVELHVTYATQVEESTYCKLEEFSPDCQARVIIFFGLDTIRLSHFIT